MKFYLGAVALCVVVFMASGYAKSQLYSLSPARNHDDASACGRMQGKAAMVADIDPAGNVIGDFKPFCLHPEK